MSSKDDTMPLPGFSQDLSIDVTLDEDFIPTSQPQRNGSPKISKNSVENSNKSTEELPCTNIISDSNIDDTLPPEAVIDQSTLDRDKSTDFIPDTETKNIKISYANELRTCKKKLPVFASEDICGMKTDGWENEVSKIPESPALATQNFSILNDSSAKVESPKEESDKPGEEFVTEIVVNDSADTVDLETTPVDVKKSESARKSIEKLDITCSTTSDIERCEETQIFDNSSILLLEQVDPRENSEQSIKELPSQKLYIQETLDDSKKDLLEKLNSFRSSSPPAVAELSKTNQEVLNLPIQNGHSFAEREAQQDSNAVEHNDSSVVIRKLEFKLTVSCFVTVNTKTNQVLQKTILKVDETAKSQRKAVYVEPLSDNASDKSKRYSTSSSGSVYSDKLGLPFALSKRVSAVSDQTDSSEDEFGILAKKERKALERVPWTNEYLLPMKMDELIQISIDKMEFLKRPNIASSPKKPKSRQITHLKNIPESSFSDSQDCRRSENVLENGTPESSESANELQGNVESMQNETPKKGENDEEKENKSEPFTCIENRIVEPELKNSDSGGVEEEVNNLSRESSFIALREGLPVFARWTDKRYYSGVLIGNQKNEKWDVKFDDGTSKTVREDFIMPADWLQKGSLVFAVVDDKYESGQIINVQREDVVFYTVDLDVSNKKILVKVSDLCLTEVMANIAREKYKPFNETPKSKADIDFDNVLSGKRLREPKTPLRLLAVQSGSSASKKKSSVKSNKNEGSSKATEDTPQRLDRKRKETETNSGDQSPDEKTKDSPSVTETSETPLRGSSSEARRKAKPRTLSYDFEETRSGRKKVKSWLAPDGTPIPGPSGVRSKKQKTKEKDHVEIGKTTPKVTRSRKSPATAKVLDSGEKSRRKRKLDEFAEDDVQKKAVKKTEARTKAKSKKG